MGAGPPTFKMHVLLLKPFTMRARFFNIALAMALLTGATAQAAGDPEVIQRNGYTLTFISQDPKLDATVKSRMIDAFFTVYPKLAAEYNANTRKDVTFFVDTAYTGVAEAANGRVRFSDDWLRNHPGDIDVVTHEVMHIVQSYPFRAGPGWLTEGIADYVRFRFGVDNAGGGWSLPNYSATQHYTNSYRITARFLDWIEKTNTGFVKKLDAAMRTNTYKPALWKDITGKDVDELWTAYSQAQTGSGQ
jgi:hypothetical protein